MPATGDAAGRRAERVLAELYGLLIALEVWVAVISRKFDFAVRVS